MAEETVWVCPHCGYEMADWEMSLKLSDGDCECGRAVWSEFEREGAHGEGE